MPEPSETERFILLPERGLKLSSDHRSFMLMIGAGSASRAENRSVDFFAQDLGPRDPAARLEVIDSVHEDGPKLVEGTPASVDELRRRGLRREPLRSYRIGLLGQFNPSRPPGVPSGANIVFRVASQATGLGIPGALVTAFTSFANREGAEGETDATGEVALDLGAPRASLDRLYVRPPLAGYWGHFSQGIKPGEWGTSIRLRTRPTARESGWG
jgi:hypothetical protein